MQQTALTPSARGGAIAVIIIAALRDKVKVFGMHINNFEIFLHYFQLRAHLCVCE